jgi:hypothetical protein
MRDTFARGEPRLEDFRFFRANDLPNIFPPLRTGVAAPLQRSLRPDYMSSWPTTEFHGKRERRTVRPSFLWVTQRADTLLWVTQR